MVRQRRPEPPREGRRDGARGLGGRGGGAAPRARGLAAFALAMMLAMQVAPAAAAGDGAQPSAGTADAGAPSAQRRRELQAEQRELKAKLAQLKKSLAAAESAHSEAADALAASESAISTVNRHLQELAASRKQVEQRIAELQRAQQEALQAQNAHAGALALAARREFELLYQPGSNDLLDPSDFLRDRRDSLFLDRIVRERARRIGELDDRRARLSELEAESRQRSEELAGIDADERASRAQLLRQEAARKATLARLSHEIAAQRQSVATLERDDARLASLIDQIGRLLAEQARRKAPRKAAPGHAPAPEAGGGERFEPPSETRFARLRGKLLLPVKGTIVSRFGAARLGEDGQPQSGAPAWKGLFIGAAAGGAVHAVAEGRVVFADWLRGFGNLIILDHGEGFLSVYANNETLLHGVGDPIAADEVIASVGNTGGNPQSGLYFEMRYQGHPFDPLGWAVAR
jgi:septal ring factor EnvC (AmiA/AmiB activator)